MNNLPLLLVLVKMLDLIVKNYELTALHGKKIVIEGSAEKWALKF